MSTPGTVLITGTTSGVGLNATCALVKRGWTVITANRSPQRAAAAADDMDLPKDRLQHVLMDLGDLDSVRRAVDALPDRLDAVVCNAAVYKPKLKQPERSPQGYEISMATNHFGHFLLVAAAVGAPAELQPPLQAGGDPRHGDGEFQGTGGQDSHSGAGGSGGSLWF